jgi:hypothetical protein
MVAMSDPSETVPPDALVATRLSLQQVAVHVLARRRHAVSGRFGLRPSPGGLATPAFGEEIEVVRTSGATLVVERGGETRREPLSTLGRAAELVAVDLAAPFSAGDDTPAPVDPGAPLTVDPAAAFLLAGWWAFGATLIDEVAAGGEGPPAVQAASTAQLWPEHFDHAATLTLAGERGGPVSANVGASPGDGGEPLPYLYVGPHGPERPGPDGYWNAPFGAVLRHADVVALPDPQRRSRALAFVREGLGRLAGR